MSEARAAPTIPGLRFGDGPLASFERVTLIQARAETFGASLAGTDPGRDLDAPGGEAHRQGPAPGGETSALAQTGTDGENDGRLEHRPRRRVVARRSKAVQVRGDKQRLLVLGAGPFQVAGIRRAVSEGYFVATADYIPHNVGHRFSDAYVNASTTDFDAVLAAAKRLGVDGITSFASDVAMPTVANVAHALGLPGPPVTTVDRLCNKRRFREMQARAGLSHPQFVSAHDAAEGQRRAAGIAGPLIVKPADSSGSRGVSRIESADDPAFEGAFREAARHGRTGEVCIEEFVEGVEVGGDAFIEDGVVAMLAVTKKHRRGFVVTGHSLPTELSDAAVARVRQEIGAACIAAEYRAGPLNFDVMVGHRAVTILEMSPRTGGNGIPELIERATGSDLLRATVALAVGERPQWPAAPPTPRRCHSMVVGAAVGGTLGSIADEATLRERVPGVFGYVCRNQPGDVVTAFEHGGTSLGYVLFDDDGRAYERQTADVESALALEVEGQSP